MNTATLFAKFSQGINWNGIFYSAHKAFTTLFSLLLFKSLSTQAFSTWANINSIIFLLLLWIDFGMRKSIPRYLPEFAKNQNTHQRFIATIITFQACVLIVTTPLILYLIGKIPNILGLQDHALFFYIGGGIFITQGVESILKLIYHAHFWNKQFNIITIIALAVEMLTNGGILVWCTSSASILKGVFITKLLSAALVNIISLSMLSRLYKDKNYPGTQMIDYNKTVIAFTKHSGMMWINNNIKSMTERNFLLPLCTYIFGAAAANLFKVANDGALFFHRTALKTIGTTDTALLSHALTSPDRMTLMPIAFTQLSKKIINLCIPLATILCIMLLLSKNTFSGSLFTFKVFFIMTTGYLLELIMSPYERILEAERRYGLLLTSYAPYIFMILSFALLPQFITSIGLTACILIIHLIRLLSTFLTVYFAGTQYRYIEYPMRHLAKVMVSCMFIITFLYLACTYAI